MQRLVGVRKVEEEEEGGKERRLFILSFLFIISIHLFSSILYGLFLY